MNMRDQGKIRLRSFVRLHYKECCKKPPKGCQVKVRTDRYQLKLMSPWWVITVSE